MYDKMLPNEASRKFCNQLLQGDYKPAGYPVYRAKHRRAIQIQAATEAEAIIHRDILPTVVPSAQILHTIGKLKEEHLRDEIDAPWMRASTMGDKHPKPDYVAGLRRSAFDEETWDKLMNYGTPDTPVLLSTATCFPLLIAEAKREVLGYKKLSTKQYTGLQSL